MPPVSQLLLVGLLAGLAPPVCVFAAEIPQSKIQKLEQWHQRAEEHILKNDFRGAIRIYQDILLEEPDDETAYTGLAQCHMVLGEFPRAKEAYQNALEINPDNETALLGLGKIADPDSLNFTEERVVKVPEDPEKSGGDL